MAKENVERIKVEILLTPSASNLSDFDPLLKDDALDVRMVKMGQEITGPDLFILPGTKNTIGDFRAMSKGGYLNKIRRLAKDGRTIFGISGGFQMLGSKIVDIKGSEYMLPQCEGIGFFRIVTRIMVMMVKGDIEFRPLPDTFEGCSYCTTASFTGFEAHLGRTRYLKGSRPLFVLTKRAGIEIEVEDGAINEDGNVLGSYIHGIFNNPGFNELFFSGVKKRKSIYAQN